jgi:hypothetical protein
MRRVALGALLVLLAACSSGSGKEAATTTSSGSTSTTLAVGRDAPTAPICVDVPTGTVVVTITIGGDGVPQPRCTKAHGDQHLKLVNQTDQVLVVDFGGLSPIVLPGRSLTTALTFDRVWGRGVHTIEGTSQATGRKASFGEVWIVPGTST